MDALVRAAAVVLHVNSIPTRIHTLAFSIDYNGGKVTVDGIDVDEIIEGAYSIPKFDLWTEAGFRSHYKSFAAAGDVLKSTLKLIDETPNLLEKVPKKKTKPRK